MTDVVRRSPRSPKGTQRCKIPMVVSSEIEEKIRNDAEKAGVTMSFLLSQIVERHYGKVLPDPNYLLLSRRIDRLEQVVFSGGESVITLVPIPESVQRGLMAYRDENDLSYKEMSDIFQIDSDVLKGVIQNKVNELPSDELERLTGELGEFISG